MKTILLRTLLFSAVSASAFAQTAAGDGNSGLFAVVTLPGLEIEKESPTPISASDLSPAVEFSLNMKTAFMTPDGLNFTDSQSATGSLVTFRNPVSTDGRRVRAVLGSSGGGGVSSGIVNPAVAVPEPGTFLTGMLLLGVCAGGSRRRGVRRSAAN